MVSHQVDLYSNLAIGDRRNGRCSERLNPRPGPGRTAKTLPAKVEVVSEHGQLDCAREWR